MARIGAILLAAGSSTRMGPGRLKQFLPLGDEPMFMMALRVLLECADDVVIAVPAGHVGGARAWVQLGVPSVGENEQRRIEVVEGGKRRRDSMQRALAALSADVEVVLVHDAARPFPSRRLVRRVAKAAAEHGAAVPAICVPDTVKRVEGDRVVATLDRSLLRLAQTPQGFTRSVIEAVNAIPEDADITDDAQAAELAGGDVVVVEGESSNFKVTTDFDLESARTLLVCRGEGGRGAVKVGMGYDSHRLGPGRPLILGGVRIPFERGLLGVSDADVLTHAICDALLGAVAEGDLGTHFPPSDSTYHGVSSLLLLAKVAEIVKRRGYSVLHVDATVVAEAPMLSPHIPGMREILSDVLKIERDDVSVKATTTEGVGPEGEGISMSAMAVALVGLSSRPGAATS